MKRPTAVLVPVLCAGLVVGCDEFLVGSLPADMQSIAAAADALKLDLSSRPMGDQSQNQDRLRLRDGSCDGTGSQNQYGGSNGSGGGGGSGNGGNSGGNGDGDRLRLRDGSCGG